MAIYSWNNFSEWKVEKFKPKPEDICSFCKGDYGKDNLISGPDSINICPECVSLCNEIIKERDDKKMKLSLAAMAKVEEQIPAGYQPSELLIALYNAIKTGVIPSIEIK